MPLPLIVSCSSKIQIGFTFLVPAHPGSRGKRAVERVCVCVYITKNIAYHIPEMLIFYADKVLLMGRSGNSSVLNFAILIKSRKLDAREIFVFYSSICLLRQRQQRICELPEWWEAVPIVFRRPRHLLRCWRRVASSAAVWVTLRACHAMTGSHGAHASLTAADTHCTAHTHLSHRPVSAVRPTQPPIHTGQHRLLQSEWLFAHVTQWQGVKMLMQARPPLPRTAQHTHVPQSQQSGQLSLLSTLDSIVSCSCTGWRTIYFPVLFFLLSFAFGYHHVVHL